MKVNFNGRCLRKNWKRVYLFSTIKIDKKIYIYKSYILEKEFKRDIIYNNNKLL
jgi:hypothetical protein